MENMKKFIGTAAALVVLGLAPAAPSSARATAANPLQLAMMDEMKMKSDSSNSSGGMGGQSSSQSQNMGGMDDKMKMPMQRPMERPMGGMGSMGGMGQSGGQSQNMGGGMDDMMRMMRMMHGQMPAPKAGMAPEAGVTASGPADVTERLEGRIAFLKAELQITDKQSADWNLLADALRSSRQHLLDARKLLVVDEKISGSERIEHYERHLAERLEAIKAARTAFNRLYTNLSDEQKKTADAILLPLIATF
ncbi:MAG: Spy/CpxP family protein refolding chaperone [Bradyrhizobium sp.]|uniref:Spy/CpxP family protein refolding chaperone n=1 Tax=Bradyrhizobium sp. TaxID=376 RepID=UPI001A271B39|nr:Spy/CpxP family protein refolding chaperone [Bradyrhizobium sp.]MBJ7402157.1 Spy/CpxP family protein refolding chaperone [Bradyrhizobium sp.]